MFIFADGKNQKYKDVTIMGGFKNIEIKNFRGFEYLGEASEAIFAKLKRF